LVRLVQNEGHEVGSHGWSHDLLYEMGVDRFRDETRRATDAISEVSGAPVTAYRAAYFSITRDSMWALDVLAALGFRYDSSIFPVQNWRYGIAGFNPRPQRLTTANGDLFEFPVSVRRLFGKDLPVSGGAYFRLYPYTLTRANFRFAERYRTPVLFYLHPWELDPDHPRIDVRWKPRLTHYANLKHTQRKLRSLLKDFSFKPLGKVLEDEVNCSRS
jgi:polysaccharide deacetylase family protein (PEP-CTERM system associated)